MPRTDLRIRASTTGLPPAARRRTILLPALAGLPPESAELLLHLPVVDVNGSCEHTLDSAAAGEIAGTTMAVFGGDPFLREEMLRALKRRRVAAVANFPSAQLVDGEAARAIELVHYGLAADLRLLSRARALGLEVLGFAYGAESARRAVDGGASSIVVHPGIATADWRQRAALAASAMQTIAAARQAGARRVLLHRPRGFGTALDAAAARADGDVAFE
jgi:predicted TIM-barrel enzyme